MTPAETRVRHLLAGRMTPQAIETWLDRWTYQGRTARQLLAAGHSEVVTARVEYIAGGGR